MHYDLGEYIPLLGRRMPDLDLVTADGRLRVFALLHDARAVLLNLGTPSAFDISPRAQRVLAIDAKYPGNWELPVLGQVAAPAAVLIRPDGYVAWVGEGTSTGLRDALTMWFGLAIQSCIDGVTRPMRNNGHDPASTPRADATRTDEDLMLELAHGRHEALGSLYSRHSRLVFYLALQSLERPAAEELVQEVFLTIWRGASAFDPDQGSFRPWLLRLAHWRILNELRRRHRRPQVQRNVDEEDELFQQVLDQEPGPEERAFQKEHRRIVDSALETLPRETARGGRTGISRGHDTRTGRRSAGCSARHGQNAHPLRAPQPADGSGALWRLRCSGSDSRWSECATCKHRQRSIATSAP